MRETVFRREHMFFFFFLYLLVWFVAFPYNFLTHTHTHRPPVPCVCFCSRNRLEILENPENPVPDQWYKDEGGRENCVELQVSGAPLNM